VKRIFDARQDDEVFAHQTSTGEAKQAAKDKRLFRLLYSRMSNSNSVELRVQKSEFMQFIKGINKDLFTENDINEIFLLLCKRLDG
jgi:hypothetical protein